MRCHRCNQETNPDQIWYCYWCGHPICGRCGIAVQLPQGTSAICCQACRRTQMANEAADASMWEIAVDASLGGHDLEAWQWQEDGSGWQVRCRLCDMTAWVGYSGVMYSLLAGSCPQEIGLEDAA